MNLTIIGAGDSTAQAGRHTTCFLLQDKGTAILIDCGFGSIHRLVEYIPYNKIDACVISHCHPDHFADLVPFIVSRSMWEKVQGLKPHPLTLCGPRALKHTIETITTLMGTGDLLNEYPIEYRYTSLRLNRHRPTVVIGSMQVTIVPVKHVRGSNLECLGFSFSCANRRLTYTGDINGNQDPAAFSNIGEPDLLVIPCGADEPHPNHLTPDQVTKFACQVGAKKTLVTHVSTDRILQVNLPFSAQYHNCESPLRLAQEGHTYKV